MTDARHPATGPGSACPDFESLSCYADGEVEPAMAAAMAAHVGGVRALRHAGGAAARGPGGRRRAARRRHRRIGLRRRRASGRVCDRRHERRRARRAARPSRRLRCVRRRAGAVAPPPLGGGGDRHAGADRRAAARPPGAREPACARSAPVAERPPPTRRRAGWRCSTACAACCACRCWCRRRWRPARCSRSPCSPGRSIRATSGERSRAIAPETVRLRVSAVEATVRSRPSMQSEVVATVQRGADAGGCRRGTRLVRSPSRRRASGVGGAGGVRVTGGPISIS